MKVFSYAGLNLLSDLPLTELSIVGKEFFGASPDIVFSLPESRPPLVPDGDWVHEWRTESGEVTLALARVNSSFFLRFPCLGDFFVHHDGKLIEAWPAAGTDDATLRHLLLDQVLPRVMSHRGVLVLHASAVRGDQGTLAFLGQTGWGKSTLAASFHTAGFGVLSDDGLMVEEEGGRCVGKPLYPGLRLLPSAVAALFPETSQRSPVAQYSEKERIGLEGPRASETKGVDAPDLRALFVLGQVLPIGPVERPRSAKVPRAVRLSQRDGCMELIRHSFQLDVKDPESVACTFRVASEVAEKLPIYSLTYPREYRSLPAVHACVRDVLRVLESSGEGQGRRV